MVNETEAAAVLGHPVDGLPGAARAAAGLVTAGARHAVVTAGAHGAALAVPALGTVSPELSREPQTEPETVEPETIEPFHVDAVDSVGAGDAFVGALAVALAAGVPAAEAVRAASAAGATAATRSGAQAGMPRPDDIRVSTGVRWPVT